MKCWRDPLEHLAPYMDILRGVSSQSYSWCKGFLGFLEKYFVFMVQRIFWDFWKNNY
nr:uncharacterized protein LOC118879674 isoform X4 [Drosophila suzukii]